MLTLCRTYGNDMEDPAASTAARRGCSASAAEACPSASVLTCRQARDGQYPYTAQCLLCCINAVS